MHALSKGYPEVTAIEPFDLLEFQKRARESCDPKRLFELWEDVCRRYDRREIGIYELEEMKEVILPNLQALAGLKRSINDIRKPAARRLRKRA